MSDRGTSTDRAPDWRTGAACTHVKPNLMFPDPGNRRAVRTALGICAACPVWQSCLTAALEEEGNRAKDNRFGIRGGLTPGQRWAAYSRRRQTAVA